MIKINNTLKAVKFCFNNGKFELSLWTNYINSVLKDSANIFLDEVENDEKNGLYSFTEKCLPVINEVVKDNNRLEEVSNAFTKITESLNQRLIEEFGKSIDVEIVLYLGLCNGAGWATYINDQKVVLLGVEKIIELKWFLESKFKALIYHELGHIYHDTYGILTSLTTTNKEKYIWQLFIEGVAMVFEQKLIKNSNYYHQFTNKELKWLEKNIKMIVSDFVKDLESISQKKQRWFGDWVKYYEISDVGYFLGAKFIHYLLEDYSFDEIILFDLNSVLKLFAIFSSKFNSSLDNS